MILHAKIHNRAGRNRYTNIGERVTGEKAADSDPGGKPAARASTESPLRSDAGIRPHDVDDRKVSIEDRLSTERETYRIQSVEEEHFFGAVTHKNLQLVKLNGR